MKKLLTILFDLNDLIAEIRSADDHPMQDHVSELLACKNKIFTIAQIFYNDTA